MASATTVHFLCSKGRQKKHLAKSPLDKMSDAKQKSISFKIRYMLLKDSYNERYAFKLKKLSKTTQKMGKYAESLGIIVIFQALAIPYGAFTIRVGKEML